MTQKPVGMHHAEIVAAIRVHCGSCVALAERLGFRREGLLRDRLMVASRPRSVLMFGLLSSDRRGEGAVTPPG